MNKSIVNRRISEYADMLCNNFCKYKKDGENIDAICKGCPLISILKTVKNEGVGETSTDIFMRQMHEETGLNYSTIYVLIQAKFDRYFPSMIDLLCEDYTSNSKNSVIQIISEFMGMDEKLYRSPYNFSMSAALQNAMFRLYEEKHIELDPDLSDHINLLYRLNNVQYIFGYENGKCEKNAKICRIPNGSYKITGRGIACNKNDYEMIGFRYCDYGKTWAFEEEELKR